MSRATTLVDSNVWLDILNQDPEWLNWSLQQLEACANQGTLLINPIIYAELLAQFSSAEPLDKFFNAFDVARAELPWEAAWPTSRAFVQYRQRGGVRTSPMPDFYIGAHALVAGCTLLTRDAQRYRHYFKSLKLISPR